MTASASTGTPRTGRPLTSAPSTMSAMAAARTTLGSGVTSTTNASSTAAASRVRAVRDIPANRPASTTSPTTIAQFAPDTAVRCERLLNFIAASSSGLTARVSPMARPGSRPAPSPARRAAASAKPSRSPFAQSRNQGGCRTSSTDDAYSRNASFSPAAATRTVPLISALPPMRSSPTEPNTTTGTPPSSVPTTRSPSGCSVATS